MPAFNFKTQFADAVARGEKRQTIRAPRKDGRPHAKEGDTISLYTGMRTKSCRLLRTGVVIAVEECEIDFESLVIGGTRIPGDLHDDDFGQNRDDIARADGFADFAEMAEWFDKTHGLPFHGVLIHWGPDLAALRIERDQLQAEIDAAPVSGAAVSAKRERIDGINRILEGAQ